MRCPSPGNISERLNAALGSTRTRAVSCRISDANEAPHVAQKSSSMGFLASQTGQGHIGTVGVLDVEGSATIAAGGDGADPAAVSAPGSSICSGSGSAERSGATGSKHMPHQAAPS
jgi:hypothetical protein